MDYLDEAYNEANEVIDDLERECRNLAGYEAAYTLSEAIDRLKKIKSFIVLEQTERSR